MRQVIYSMMMSLDGFIARPGGELDWVIITDELHTFINDRESTFDTHLYGRRMYEVMAAHWPTADQNPAAPAYEADYARIWQRMSKVVFSTTLDTVEWNSRLVRDNIAEEMATLKAQPGKHMGLGGANIAATFLQLGLVDAYQIYVHPVILGSGTRMFPASDNSIGMRLVETRSFDSGVVFLHYQRAGDGD